MSRNEEFDAARTPGEQAAQRLLDGAAQAFGYQDDDHRVMSRRNQQELDFKDLYSSGTGRGTVRWDQDRETHVYEVRHPSGWVGRHFGPHTEMSHVTTPGAAHDMWSYVDHSRHGLMSGMQSHEWPSPSEVDAHVDDWVKNYGQDYEEWLPKRGRK